MTGKKVFFKNKIVQLGYSAHFFYIVPLLLRVVYIEPYDSN